MHSEEQDSKYEGAREPAGTPLNERRSYELSLEPDGEGSSKLVFVASLAAAVIVTLTGLIAALIIDSRDDDHQMELAPVDASPTIAHFGTAQVPIRSIVDCLEVVDCLLPTPEFRAAYSDPLVCSSPGKRVCLVPLGSVSKELIEYLVAYYRSEYRLTAAVLPPVSIVRGRTVSGHERQVEADHLRLAMLRAYPVLNDDADANLIGITSTDLYLDDMPSWKWAFGATYAFDIQGVNIYRQAVVSTYRMDPRTWGLQENDSLYKERVRKMTNRYVAMTYYGLPKSQDPRSVTYGNIGGVGDLDRLNERIPVSR